MSLQALFELIYCSQHKTGFFMNEGDVFASNCEKKDLTRNRGLLSHLSAILFSFREHTRECFTEKTNILTYLHSIRLC